MVNELETLRSDNARLREERDGFAVRLDQIEDLCGEALTGAVTRDEWIGTIAAINAIAALEKEARDAE